MKISEANETKLAQAVEDHKVIVHYPKRGFTGELTHVLDEEEIADEELLQGTTWFLMRDVDADEDYGDNISYQDMVQLGYIVDSIWVEAKPIENILK